LLAELGAWIPHCREMAMMTEVREPCLQLLMRASMVTGQPGPTVEGLMVTSKRPTPPAAWPVQVAARAGETKEVTRRMRTIPKKAEARKNSNRFLFVINHFNGLAFRNMVKKEWRFIPV
jgi:hypothetical protein